MGKKNTLMKDYMSEPAHFADCFNHYLFHGKRVIRPEHLRTLDPMEIAIIPQDTTEETAEKIRDILKSCILMQDDRATYLLLGIERNVGEFAEFLTRLNVGEMDLDCGNADGLECIENGNAGMRICRRIDDDTFKYTVCRLDHVNDLALVVRLKEGDAVSKLLGRRADKGLQRVEILLSVNVRLADAKHIQIRSVDNEYFHDIPP